MLIGHGGNIYAAAKALRCRPEEILDFSSNVSPLPLKDEFLKFLSGHLRSIQHLPEPDSMELRQKVASRYGLSPENVLIGPGTTQWIYDLPMLRGIERVVIVVPTYADYEDAARIAGKEICYFSPPAAHNGAQLEWDDPGLWLPPLLETIREGDLVFFCNPNNPNGFFIDPTKLKEAISLTPGAIWCIDESYAPFVAPDGESSLLPLGIQPNCVVLRSFSKIYGIPGLRLGAILGHAKTVEALSRAQRPWAVARLSQLAGIYLMARPGWADEAREYLKGEKAYLFEAIQEIPHLNPIRSKAHFFLIQVTSPLIEVHELSLLLMNKRILIRDCGNFRGLEGKNVFRVSPRTHGENEALVRCLRDIVTWKHH